MILYKYYPPNEYSFKSLAVRGLWCHYPGKMNDPFECLGMNELKFSSGELNEFRQLINKSNSEVWKNLDDKSLLENINRHRNSWIKRFSFCALSETPDNILMWSHYTRGHSGFVLAIDFSDMTKDHHLQKVSYETDISKFNLQSYAKFMAGDDSYLSEMLSSISIKTPDWHYEKEWRIWKNGHGYYEYAPNQVKAIYFGINIEEDVKRAVFELTTYMPDESKLYSMEFAANPARLKY